MGHRFEHCVAERAYHIWIETGRDDAAANWYQALEECSKSGNHSNCSDDKLDALLKHDGSRPQESAPQESTPQESTPQEEHSPYNLIHLTEDVLLNLPMDYADGIVSHDELWGSSCKFDEALQKGVEQQLTKMSLAGRTSLTDEEQNRLMADVYMQCLDRL